MMDKVIEFITMATGIGSLHSEQRNPLASCWERVRKRGTGSGEGEGGTAVMREAMRGGEGTVDDGRRRPLLCCWGGRRDRMATTSSC